MTQTTIIPEHLDRIAIDALLPYARNARTHSDGQVEQLVTSIREVIHDALTDLSE